MKNEDKEKTTKKTDTAKKSTAKGKVVTTKKSSTAKTKKATTTKKSTTKRTVTPKVKSEIKSKVDDLTKDLDEILDVTEVAVKPKTTKKDNKVVEKSNTWLKEEFDRLVEENKKFEQELIELRKQVSDVGVNDSAELAHTKLAIKNIYEELMSNFTGRNPGGVPWVDVKIKYLLDKFELMFEFL